MPNIQVQEPEYCKLNITYSAEADVVKNKIAEAFNKFKEAKIPGFRKGKATKEAVNKKYQKEINELVKAEMLNHANDDILFETKIRPLGAPQVNKIELNGLDFKCNITYIKKPEFKLCDVKALEVPAPHMPQTVEALQEQIINNTREQFSNSKPYEDSDFVTVGDSVTMSYTVGTEEEKSELYVVGSKLFEEFDDSIMGMIPGETRNFQVLSDGVKKDCTVTIHMGMKKTPCSLDELPAKCGAKDMEHLVSLAQGMAGNQYKQLRDSKITDQLKIQLVSKHDFEPPTWLTNMEAQNLASQANLKWDDLTEEVKSSYLEQGKQNVKFTLILDSIRVEVPEADLSETEAIEGIKQTVKNMNKSVNIDEWLRQTSNNGMLHGLIARYKNDFSLNWLINNVKVVD